MSDPEEAQIQEAAAQEIPAVLPVLPLRDTVVFPDTMIPLTIGQERSIKLIDDVLAGDRLLAMVTSRDAEVETPGPDLLYPVGTVGLAHKMIKLPDGTMRILVQGLQRVRVKEYVSEEPYLVARTEKIEDVATESKESEALRASLLSVFSKIVALVPYLPEELEMAAANVEEPGPLTFLIASTMRIKAEDKQALLEEDDVEARMRKLIGILTRELDVLELGSKIQSDVRGEIDKSQREYFLRQQMRAIQQELGETDEQEAEVNETPQEGRGAGAPGGGRQGGPPRARPPQPYLAAERRISGHPHLPGLDHHPAVERPQRGQPRHGARPRDPRPGPLRPREGQGPHPRVPGRAQAQGRPARADPLLRRPARRRQDEPRPQSIAEAMGRKFVRIVARRRARRGRDPRASPHLRRRDARHHHPAPCATPAPTTRCS